MLTDAERAFMASFYRNNPGYTGESCNYCRDPCCVSNVFMTYPEAAFVIDRLESLGRLDVLARDKVHRGQSSSIGKMYDDQRSSIGL